MAPMRRFRSLIAFVTIWIAGLWYFRQYFGYPEPQPAPFPVSAGTGNPFKGGLSHEDGKPRWTKLPDRYPVTALRAIPTDRPATPIPKIQKSPAPVEDAAAKALRLERGEAVRDSFLHSWQGYKDHAWLHDEVKPLSKQDSNPFGGWAATLVDALDTLWMMGLKEEFEKAVRACEQIDFTTTETEEINVFETTIRYLGGFLAAYELSDKAYPTLLDKAAEVGELLMCAFDTPNRMPIARWRWKDYTAGNYQKVPSGVLVSEIGSLSLEFTKLSQLTGDMKYYDAVQRISDEFEKSQNTGKLPGMWPIVIGPHKTPFDMGGDSFTLGGMSDSLYEYFPKQYLLLGGALQQPRKLYEGFIDVAKEHLFRRVMNPDNTPLIISGDVTVNDPMDGTGENVINKPEGQHLTCFTGGMVGIASRIFNRPSDLEVAKQLTDACVWSYKSMGSGIGPEIWRFVSCGGIEDSQTGDSCTYSDSKWRAAVLNHWRPRDPGVHHEETAEELENINSELDKLIRAKRLPPGFVDVRERKYILRPEAIESVFIIYRLTGDSSWMDKAWEMFQAVERHTRTSVAAASLDDVTKENPTQVDSMESFWLAETLKYFYLVFSEWDTVDLDRWVLNTEAHPLRRMHD